VITERPAVLDTCILINLLATGRIAEIIRVIAPACLVCSVVSRESLYLRPLDEAAGTREAVDLAPLFDAGVLTACQIEGPAEEDLYVNYAFELDDGEAMSLAIAQARNLALATDERKARRVARENAPQLSMISTAEIIWAWAQERDEADAIAVVRSILTRARFRPSASDPLAPWWDELLER
jgi:predicted nucleic acid-binding protein